MIRGKKEFDKRVQKFYKRGGKIEEGRKIDK